MAAIFHLPLSYTDSCATIYCAVVTCLAAAVLGTHHCTRGCQFMLVSPWAKGPLLIHFRYVGCATGSGSMERLQSWVFIPNGIIVKYCRNLRTSIISFNSRSSNNNNSSSPSGD